MIDDLIGLADEIRTVHQEILGIMVLESEGWKRDRLSDLFEQYDAARRRLRVLVHEQRADILIPGSAHADARRVLQASLLGEMPLDRLLADDAGNSRIEFTDGEIEVIVEEYLSRFSYLTYAENKLNGAALVLRAESLAPEATRFVDEIVECYAFERYDAVYALCRMALEAALRPVYRSAGLADPDSAASRTVRERIWSQRYPDRKKSRLTDESRLYVEDFSPDIDQMITRICWLDPFNRTIVPRGLTGDEPLRQVLHRIRDHGNSIIHGNRTVGASSARAMMHDLFRGLHTLYEVAPNDGTA